MKTCNNGGSSGKQVGNVGYLLAIAIRQWGSAHRNMTLCEGTCSVPPASHFVLWQLPAICAIAPIIRSTLQAFGSRLV